MSISAAQALLMSSAGAAKPGTTTDVKASSAAKSAKDEFLDYARMTPAQRMHAALLAQMGLTEKEFEALPAAQRKAIEETIREEIKRQMESKGGSKPNGMIADLSV